jgi:hypothetical protein
MTKFVPTAAVAVLLGVSPPAIAEECAIVDLPKAGEAKVCVSSVLKPVRGITYGPELMFDRKLNTAWTEGVAGDGVGQYIQIYFDKPTPVRGLQITNGYPKNDDIYKWNGRVKQVSITTSGGDSGKFVMKDTPKPQFVPVPGRGAILWVRLTIRGVYRGERYRDTTISEIRVDIGGDSDTDYLHVQPPIRPTSPPVTPKEKPAQ